MIIRTRPRPVHRAAAALGTWSLAVLAVTWLSLPPSWFGAPLRLALVGGFLVAGPGAVLVLLLRLEDRLLSAVVAVCASLVLLTVGAQTSLHTGLWSPAGVVSWIAGLTLVGCGVVAGLERYRGTPGV